MKVLVTDPIHEDGIKKLEEFADVEVATGLDQESLLEKVPDFGAMIVRSATKVGKDLLDAGGNLKLIVRAGVGLDNIDLDTAKERNIKVVNTPEAPTTAVAELTISLMLAWARKIPKADKAMKEGKWIKSQLVGTELKDKTLGIIGTGRIGREVARRAKALGMNLLGYDVEKSDEFKEMGGEYVGLEELLQNSDYVTLHVPLIPPTRHMISEEELNLMKSTAVLVNAARGPIVDEEALIKALKNEKIAGACIDVCEHDPPEESPLTQLDNVILTPHLGASTREAQRTAGVLAAEKIRENLK
ncbi:3-phosphoglycerate dehydrogenase [candidate division MSBL1 archaeon SCGC-AAA261G05]|uniref:3-phosphoglycerate dehydrogenase n=3 Tax=candidate division MSBL1 TaxID=215777 RepID=A0A133V1H5_9EURY|nr:3-phosphoglycerate dehydrogenase [candidate division MSBL1 archaeon SCGC-AAA261C02]KXB04166.1 3-phosphoglycerate dehydrogenase [candidate division MSBL1 archaeon SCGC-AAA261G05]KXB04384.1 3-phosphoglycerate dehydrogenase [candidate division MSBL1 archaeon SCGC-AAA261O19]